MTKITCYTGPMEALSTYLYNPVSKSRIRFDDYGEIINIENMQEFPKQALENLEKVYKNKAKEVEIDETEFNTLCTAFKKLQDSKDRVKKLSRSLVSKLY